MTIAQDYYDNGVGKFTGGSQHIIGGAIALGPVYADSTYYYYGESLPGTALTAAEWRVTGNVIVSPGTAGTSPKPQHSEPPNQRLFYAH